MIARNWKWIAATLLVAAVVHGATVFLLPRFVMLRTMAGIAKSAGINTVMHAPRATWRSRGVVRPSPDFLYSICVYDLSAADGAVRVSTHDMPETYWSVSVFTPTPTIFMRCTIGRQRPARRISSWSDPEGPLRPADCP